MSSSMVMLLAGRLALSIVAGVRRPELPAVPRSDEQVPPEALADEDSRFVVVNGVKLHYKQYGQGQPVILLLHSLAESVFSWRQVVGPLAEGATVVAFDRPAHGLTERVLPPFSGENPYGTAAQARLTVGLMDVLGIDRAVLVGNSAGGTVAVVTCLEYPERVAALVLVSAAVYETGSPEWLHKLFTLLPLRRVAPSLLRWALPRSAGLLNRAWYDPSLVTAEQFEGYKKPLYVENWDRAFVELIRASQPLHLAERLHEITAPTLVLTGERDGIVPPDYSARLAQDIVGGELHILPECGHVPQEECPERFLAVMQAFLIRLGLFDRKGAAD